MASSRSKTLLSSQDFLATPLSQADIERRRADLQAYLAPRELLSAWCMGGEVAAIVSFVILSFLAPRLGGDSEAWTTFALLPAVVLLVPGVFLTTLLTTVRPLVTEMHALEPEQVSEMAWLLEHTASAVTLRQAEVAAPRPFIRGELLALRAAYGLQKKAALESNPGLKQEKPL